MISFYDENNDATSQSLLVAKEAVRWLSKLSLSYKDYKCQTLLISLSFYMKLVKSNKNA